GTHGQRASARDDPVGHPGLEAPAQARTAAVAALGGAHLAGEAAGGAVAGGDLAIGRGAPGAAHPARVEAAGILADGVAVVEPGGALAATGAAAVEAVGPAEPLAARAGLAGTV